MTTPPVTCTGSNELASKSSPGIAPLPVNNGSFHAAVALCVHDVMGRLLPVNTDKFLQEYHSVTEVADYLTYHVFPLDVVCYNLIQWWPPRRSEAADEHGRHPQVSPINAGSTLAVGHIAPLRDRALSELEPVTTWPPSSVFDSLHCPQASLSQLQPFVRVIHVYALSSLSARHKELNRELLQAHGSTSAAPFASLRAAIAASRFSKIPSNSSFTSASTANLTASVTSWQHRPGTTTNTQAAGIVAGMVLPTSASSVTLSQLPHHDSSVSLGIAGSPLRPGDSGSAFSPPHSFASQTLPPPPGRALEATMPPPPPHSVASSTSNGGFPRGPPVLPMAPPRVGGSSADYHSSPTEATVSSFAAAPQGETADTLASSFTPAAAAMPVPPSTPVPLDAHLDATAASAPTLGCAARSASPVRLLQHGMRAPQPPVALPATAASPAASPVSAATGGARSPRQAPQQARFPLKVGQFVEARTSGQSRYSRRSDSNQQSNPLRTSSAGGDAARQSPQLHSQPPSHRSTAASPTLSSPSGVGGMAHAPSVESHIDSLATHTTSASSLGSAPAGALYPAQQEAATATSPGGVSAAKAVGPRSEGFGAAMMRTSGAAGPAYPPSHSLLRGFAGSGRVLMASPGAARAFRNVSASTPPLSAAARAAPPAGSVANHLGGASGFALVRGGGVNDVANSALLPTSAAAQGKWLHAASLQGEYPASSHSPRSGPAPRTWNNPVPPLAKSTVSLAMALHLNDVEPLERLLTHYTCFEEELLERILVEAHPFLQLETTRAFMASPDPRTKTVSTTSPANGSIAERSARTARQAVLDAALSTGSSVVRRDRRHHSPFVQDEGGAFTSARSSLTNSKTRRSRVNMTRPVNPRERMPELFRCYFRHLRTAQACQWNLPAVMQDTAGLTAALLPLYGDGSEAGSGCGGGHAMQDSSAGGSTTSHHHQAGKRIEAEAEAEAEGGEGRRNASRSLTGTEWELEGEASSHLPPLPSSCPSQWSASSPHARPHEETSHCTSRTQHHRTDLRLSYQGEVLSNAPLTLQELRAFLAFTPELAARLHERPLSEMDQARRAQVVHLQRQYAKLITALSADAYSRSQSHMHSPVASVVASHDALLHDGGGGGSALPGLSETVALWLLRGAKDNLALATDALHYLAWRDTQECGSAAGAGGVTPSFMSNLNSHSQRLSDSPRKYLSKVTATRTPEFSAVSPIRLLRSDPLAAAEPEDESSMTSEPLPLHRGAPSTPVPVVGREALTARSSLEATPGMTASLNSSVRGGATTATCCSGGAVAAAAGTHARTQGGSEDGSLSQRRRPSLSAYSAGNSTSTLPPERSHATMLEIERTIAESAWMAGIEEAVRSRRARVESIAAVVETVVKDPNAIATLWYSSEGDAMQALKVVVQAVNTSRRM